MAAQGVAAVTFEAMRGDPVPDFRALFSYLKEHGKENGIDASRIAVWACSGNVLLGLPWLMSDGGPALAAAVLFYGDGDVPSVRKDVPVLVARAALDRKSLNESLDALVTKARAAGAPWTVMDLPRAHHGFDVLDDTDESKRAVQLTADFLLRHLSRPPGVEPRSVARDAFAAYFSGDWGAAAERYGRYVETFPSDATGHLKLGTSLQKLGKATEAAGPLRKAAALFEKEAESKGAGGVASYNAACAHARAGEAPEALGALARAVAQGFKDVRTLETDEDLESLRSEPRFQAILKSMK
jgi:dienelactone hydrolase